MQPNNNINLNNQKTSPKLISMHSNENTLIQTFYKQQLDDEDQKDIPNDMDANYFKNIKMTNKSLFRGKSQNYGSRKAQTKSQVRNQKANQAKK